MINLYIKSFLKSNIFISIIIFFFSFSINYYYSNLGVFPIDTFFHYDSSFRILKNELPIRDFWIVSGFVIDFIQSLFFKIFGINWNSYVIHSSIMNFIVSIVIYYYFLDLKIDKLKSLIFSCCFAILAYTISGTPFVDHHATFFLLISTVLLVKTINNEKKYIWIIIVFLFFLSFLTKQVPASYFFVIQGVIISFYIFLEKKYFILKYIFLSFITFLLIFLLFLGVLKIDINSFYVQYFAYPQAIGSSRFENFNLTFNDFFNNYKFLLLPLIIIVFLKFNKLKKKNSNFSKKDLYGSLILLSFIICILFHQIMTKNQIFVYFLVPILLGKLYSELNSTDYKFQKYFNFILMISLILITLKYHNRYNESRKFHELENINLSYALPASKIDNSLNGLSWINPFFETEPEKEIFLLKKSISVLNNQKTEIMLFSHYLFLDSVTNKNLNYPSRSFTLDGASMPLKNNKYFKFYKKFLIKNIQDKEIKKVFFFKHEKILQNSLTDYLEHSCYTRYEDDLFYIYELKCYTN